MVFLRPGEPADEEAGSLPYLGPCCHSAHGGVALRRPTLLVTGQKLHAPPPQRCPMAMTPSLFSIEALAVELGRDRRTVAKALRGFPCDGELNGRPAWRLQTALRALRARDDVAVGGEPALAEMERLVEDLQDQLRR